jgi:hypothetical protein
MDSPTESFGPLEKFAIGIIADLFRQLLCQALLQLHRS